MCVMHGLSMGRGNGRSVAACIDAPTSGKPAHHSTREAQDQARPLARAPRGSGAAHRTRGSTSAAQRSPTARGVCHLGVRHPVPAQYTACAAAPVQHNSSPTARGVRHLRVRHAVLVQHKDVEPVVLGDVRSVSGARPVMYQIASHTRSLSTALWCTSQPATRSVSSAHQSSTAIEHQCNPAPPLLHKCTPPPRSSTRPPRRTTPRIAASGRGGTAAHRAGCPARRAPPAQEA